jgi:hypothetical protein
MCHGKKERKKEEENKKSYFEGFKWGGGYYRILWES